LTIDPDHAHGKRGPAGAVWSPVTPADHAVLLYHSEPVFLQALAAYVAEGLLAGEGVVVIATAEHAAGLEERLRRRGLDPEAARAEGRFHLLDAKSSLARFMDGGWPDEARFREVAGRALAAARGPGRPVRSFGEMVALLWRQGHAAATHRLEYLWNRLQQEECFYLLCAYPLAAFAAAEVAPLLEICTQHSHAVAS
jgi:hypothetical protein